MPDLRQKDRKLFLFTPPNPGARRGEARFLLRNFGIVKKIGGCGIFLSPFFDAGLLYIVRREILYCFLKFYDIMEIGYI